MLATIHRVRARCLAALTGAQDPTTLDADALELPGLKPADRHRILEHERAVADAIRRGFAGAELDTLAA